MNKPYILNHIPCSKIFKGIGIAFVLTFVMCLIGYLLLELFIYFDHHINTMKNRLVLRGRGNIFMGLWFLHSCYCVICEFIPKNRRRLYRLGYLYSLIVWILIPFTSNGHPATHGVIFRLSAFSIPFVILTRGITERLIVKEKFIQAILNWKIVYLFWTISFIVLFVVQVTTNLTVILKIYWWTLGIATTLVGLYFFYNKQWINGLLYFCLFLFPMIAFKLGMLVKELLIYGQLK